LVVAVFNLVDRAVVVVDVVGMRPMTICEILVPNQCGVWFRRLSGSQILESEVVHHCFEQASHHTVDIVDHCTASAKKILSPQNVQRTFIPCPRTRPNPQATIQPIPIALIARLEFDAQFERVLARVNAVCSLRILQPLHYLSRPSAPARSFHSDESGRLVGGAE
jgi:hypothetical protein